MRTETLNAALLLIHKEAGLKVTRPRPNLLCLETENGSPVSYFDITATVEQIRRAADTWMKEVDAVSYCGGR